MTLKAFCEAMDLTLLTPEVDQDTIVTSGYTCDLLSWVMAHGQEGMAWVTVQTHMNVVAVALLMEMACVILPEGILPEQATLDKAKEEGMALFSSRKTAYHLCAQMAELGISAAHRT